MNIHAFRRYLLVCLMLVLAVAPEAHGQDEVRMGLNLEEGAKYRYVVTNDMNTNMTMQGMPGGQAPEMKMAQNQTMTYTYDVVDVADKGATTIRVALDRLQTDASMPGGQSMQYDSDDPTSASAPGMEPMRAMVDQTFTMTVTPDGEVTELEGFDEMIDALAGDMAGDDPAARDSARAMAKRMVSEESIVQMMGAGFTFYPGKPVRVGDSWDTSYTMRTMMDMTVDATYTLEGIENGQAVLSMTGRVYTQEGEPPFQLGPSGSATMTVDGTQEGTMRVDLATGLPVSSTINQDMTSDMSMTMEQGGQTMNMQIDGDIDGTSTIEVTPLDE